MTRWALILVALLMGPGVAWAQPTLTGAGGAPRQSGLSPTEKDQARKAYEATRQAHLAIENFAEAVRVATGTTARSALSDVWSGIAFHAREAGLGSLLLIGVNTAMNDITAMETREALPRATWVSDAFTHHDAVLANVSFTSGQVDTALAVGGQVAGYTTSLTAVKANLTAMAASLTSIDRALTYTQARSLPFCRNPDAATIGPQSLVDTKRGPCNVFGPHGNWIMATQHLNQGWQQVISQGLLPNLRLVYTANDGAETVMPDSTNGAIADMLVDFSRLSENIMAVTFNFAMIAITSTQCGFTPLQLVMRSIERLLQFGDTTNSVTPAPEGGPLAGLPFFWTFRGNMLTTLDAMNTALSTRPVTHALFNTNLSDRLEAWRLTEGGFWFAFEMPSDIRNVIIGGTQTGSPTPGTVTFPYYFGITRGDELRVYVRAAGGSTLRTPLIQDTDYTITGIGNPAGGTITITPAPPTDQHVEIERVGGTRLEAHRVAPYAHNDPAVGTVGPCN